MKDLIGLGSEETEPELSYLVTLHSLKKYYTSAGNSGMGALNETQARCVEEINQELMAWEMRGQDTVYGEVCEAQRKKRLLDRLVEITYAETEEAAVKRVSGEFTALCKANVKVLDKCVAAYGTSAEKEDLRALLLASLKDLEELATAVPPLAEKFQSKALLTRYQVVEDKCTRVLSYEEDKLARGEGSKIAYQSAVQAIKDEVSHQHAMGGVAGYHLRAIVECEDRWAWQNDRMDAAANAKASGAHRAQQTICQSNDLYVKYENRLGYVQQLNQAPGAVPWPVLETHFIGLCRAVFQKQANAALKMDQCTPEEEEHVRDLCRDLEDRLLSDDGRGTRTGWVGVGLNDTTGVHASRCDEKCEILPPPGVEDYCHLLERIETAHIVTAAAATAKRNAVEASVARRMQLLGSDETEELADPLEVMHFESAVSQMQTWLQNNPDADYNTYDAIHRGNEAQLPQPVTRKLDVIEDEIVNARHHAAVDSVRVLRQTLIRNMQKEQVALRLLDHYKDVLTAVEGAQKRDVVPKVDMQIDVLAARLGFPDKQTRTKISEEPLNSHVGVMEELVAKWKDTSLLPPQQFAQKQGELREDLQACLDLFATRHTPAGPAHLATPPQPPHQLRPMSPCEDSTTTPNMQLARGQQQQHQQPAGVIPS